MPRVPQEKRQEFRDFLELIPDDGSKIADDWTLSFYDIDSTLNSGSGIIDNINIGVSVPNEISPNAPFIYMGGSSMGVVLAIRNDDPFICHVSFTTFWTIEDAKQIVRDLTSAIVDAEAMEVSNR